ncbi:MAG: trigger factor [Nitrospinae bacterium CG11_big_fil_rev_8_21_14_0_20_45_15]|nr:MAG: trigger factor [Nitrospinae bacterium CG11_big_fil_rev_8_21_14_0_20_45_15]
MQVEVEKLEGLKRKLNITIPGETVSQSVEGAYQKLNQQITMAGFRPGKIPRKVLEQQVPLQSLTQMFQELLQEHYEKALAETGLVPVSAPEMDHSQLADVQKDAPLTFSVTIEIRSEFELVDYKGWKLKKKEIKVNDDQLAEAIQMLRDRHGYLDHHDDGHKAQNGDIVTLDFEGYLEGHPLEGGSAKDYMVRLGEKKMISGFEEQLVGHEVNDEFEVKVVLPQTWNNRVRRVSIPIPGAESSEPDDLASFQVKIKELKHVVPAELDEKLAQKEGCRDIDELKRKIKTEMQVYGEQNEEIKIKETIFNKLVKEHDIQPPESMVDTELKFMIEGMKFQIQQSGMTLEDSGFDPDNARKEWLERATFNSKGYMILGVIADKEKIYVTKEDLDLEYRQLAEQTKQKVEDVRKRMMSNQEVMEQTSIKIRGRKALNLIYSNCEFEYHQGDGDVTNKEQVESA